MDKGRANPQGVAGWLMGAREAKGWSQDDLAAQSGVSQPSISRYEAGKGTKRANVRKLARAVTGSEEKADVVVALSNASDATADVIRWALVVMDLPERDREIVFGLVEMMERTKG